MKSKLTNSLKYTGIVTLSKYNGAKKIKLLQVHNTGNTQLFDFLADCFSGEIERAMVKKPAKIKLLTIDDADFIEEASSGFIGLFSQPVASVSESGCKITYSFLIPRDQLVSLTSMNNLGLGLYSKNASNDGQAIYDYIARCKLDKLTASDVYSSSSLVVDWELNISNGAKV